MLSGHTLSCTSLPSRWATFAVLVLPVCPAVSPGWLCTSICSIWRHCRGGAEPGTAETSPSALSRPALRPAGPCQAWAEAGEGAFSDERHQRTHTDRSAEPRGLRPLAPGHPQTGVIVPPRFPLHRAGPPRAARPRGVACTRRERAGPQSGASLAGGAGPWRGSAACASAQPG